MTTAIDEIFAVIAHVIQSYGWPILFTLLALYFAFPSLQQWRNDVSTRLANSSHRRAVLDEEMKRARLRQQLEVIKATKEAPKTESVPSKPPQPTITKPATSKSLSMKSSSRDYNPLLGPNGGANYRPSRPTRKRGG